MMHPASKSSSRRCRGAPTLSKQREGREKNTSFPVPISNLGEGSSRSCHRPRHGLGFSPESACTHAFPQKNPNKTTRRGLQGWWAPPLCTACSRGGNLTKNKSFFVVISLLTITCYCTNLCLLLPNPRAQQQWDPTPHLVPI